MVPKISEIDVMKKIFYFRFIVSIFLSLAALTACAQGINDSNPKVTFPLLAECENSVTDYLDNTPNMAGLSFRVVKFDQTLDSHASVIGYVELETKIDSKDGLVMIFNTIKSNCYPETSTTMAIDKNLGNEVINLLHINNRMGISNTYFVVAGGSLKAYYQDK